MSADWIRADWPVPATIVAGTTLRAGDASELPSEPLWLNQVHGATVLRSDDRAFGGNPPDADASISSAANEVIAVRTADCLPVLICTKARDEIAAAHCGGRGLAEREAGGFQAGDVDPELSETAWCCYAWPVERGVTGRRTFFVNQAGDVLETSDGGYAGERGPEPCAAFDPSTHSYGITGKIAIDSVGNDRATWSQAR